MICGQAIAAARSTPFGTAAHQAAAEICLVRGLDPNAPDSWGLGLMNWQVVIAEEMLRAMLLRELAI